MPYDERERFWLEKRDGVYSNKEMSYRPPPDGEPPERPPPMGASQEAIDAFDRKQKEDKEMAMVDGHENMLEGQLCEAWGLDPNEVYSLDLSFRAGKAAILTVLMYPDKSKLNGGIAVLKRFELVPKQSKEGV